MDRPLVAVVLAGGIGSRLYPASRSDRPKQFLSLASDQSLLRETVDRASFADELVVVTRADFAVDVREHAPEAEVLIEPEGKDTGPALVYATHYAQQEFGECVVLALPSDHHVADGDEFSATLRTGARVATETEGLVTFGIEPTRADTGYGYIEPGIDHDDYADLEAFHEKPDAETAERYVREGYLWNAGIFAWTPEALLAEARGTDLAPLVDGLDVGDPEHGYEAIDAASIDYAIMEQATDAAVVPAAFDWDDLGSWDALARVLGLDEDGNAIQGDALTVDAGDNVIIGEDAHISLVGVDDLAVVAWDDRVLVVPKDQAQRVRDVVSQLRDRGEF